MVGVDANAFNGHLLIEIEGAIRPASTTVKGIPPAFRALIFVDRDVFAVFKR